MPLLSHKRSEKRPKRRETTVALPPAPRTTSQASLDLRRQPRCQRAKTGRGKDGGLVLATPLHAVLKMVVSKRAGPTGLAPKAQQFPTLHSVPKSVCKMEEDGECCLGKPSVHGEAIVWKCTDGGCPCRQGGGGVAGVAVSVHGAKPLSRGCMRPHLRTACGACQN